MTKKQLRILNSLYIIALIFYAFSPFIKFYHEVAMLPGTDGEGNFIITEFDYYFSAFENIKDLFSFGTALTIVVILEILLGVSVGFVIKDLIKNENKARIFVIASTIATGLVLFIAIFGTRCY